MRGAQPVRQEGQGAFPWPTPRGAVSYNLSGCAGDVVCDFSFGSGFKMQAVKAHCVLRKISDSGGVKSDGIRTLPCGSELHLGGGVDESGGKEKEAGWEMFNSVDVGFADVGAKVPVWAVQDPMRTGIVWDKSVRPSHDQE